MTDTAAVQTTTPPASLSTPQAAAVTSVTPSTPMPGWRSSEAVLTFLAMLLGALPSSGLLSGSPLAAKLVGMAIAALAAIGYTTNRTSLKRAHLAASSLALTSPANGNVAGKLPAVAAAALVAILVAFGCTSSQTAAVVNGGNAFLSCAKQDLTQLVTVTDPATGATTTSTLLATVANDLVSGDYMQAVADLIVRLGSDAVGCAVLAVDTVVEAGKTSGAAALTPIELRARELIAKYNWRLSPTPAAPPPAAKAAK